MAEIQNWQKQNMSKNGGSSAPCSMNPKLMPKDPASGLHSKIAKPTVGMGGMVMSNASRKVVPRFADGGMVQDDATGVDAAVARNAADDANRETATGEWMRGENYGDGTTGDERVAMAKAPEQARMASNDEVRAAASEGAAKSQSFKEAFAENRKAGNKTFEYNGKSFTTDLKTARANRTDEEKKQEARSVVAKSLSASKSAPVDFGDDAGSSSTSTKYETPYDRMNRQNREMSAARAETKAETSRLASRYPAQGRGVINTSNIDPVTLLPRR